MAIGGKAETRAVQYLLLNFLLFLSRLRSGTRAAIISATIVVYGLGCKERRYIYRAG